MYFENWSFPELVTFSELSLCSLEHLIKAHLKYLSMTGPLFIFLHNHIVKIIFLLTDI